MRTPALDHIPTPTQAVAGHSPGQERPLAGYAVLTGAYLSACGAFASWLWRSGRRLPDRPDPTDLALLAVATHKSSRMITRDRVTSTVRAPFTTFQGDDGLGEVSEAARGRGLRRAIGELLVCPYCLGMWVSTAFLAGLLTAPRVTRWIAAAFVVLTGADGLQIAYARAERLLD